MKLSPDNREALLDVLTPPPGYRVDAALGTTYTVDLGALTAALLTLAGFEWPEEGEAKVPTARFIGARQHLRNRFRLLFDQGRLDARGVRQDAIHRVQQLESFLVARQQKSAFHPKVWVVKFVAEEGKSDDLYRLLCASRNLTTSASWELGVMMEGGATGRPQPIGNAIADLLVASSEGVALPGPLRDLLTEIKSVEFGIPGVPSERLSFLAQWPQRKSEDGKGKRVRPGAVDTANLPTQGCSLWEHVPPC